MSEHNLNDVVDKIPTTNERSDFTIPHSFTPKVSRTYNLLQMGLCPNDETHLKDTGATRTMGLPGATLGDRLYVCPDCTATYWR